MNEPADANLLARMIRSTPIRLGVTVAGLAGLLVTASIAMGASPSPSASGAPSASTVPNYPGGWSGPNGKLPGGGFGGHDGIGGQISITAINGSNLSLKTDDGWRRTITVAGSTTITKGGTSIALSGLKVGDRIRFAETRNADGSYAVTAINVVLPTVGGEVTAKTATTITVLGRDNASHTIHVGSGTTYNVSGVTTAHLSDITVGMRIVAEGTQRADETLDAVVVYGGVFRGPMFHGPGEAGRRS
jgi:hypothetical protein